MGRLTQKLMLTRKKSLSTLVSETRSRVQRLRVEFFLIIGEVKLADLVFVDEAGVNLAMSRRYARSPQGTRAYSERPDTLKKNVTMIGGVSLNGFIASLIFQGGTDTLA